MADVTKIQFGTFKRAAEEMISMAEAHSKELSGYATYLIAKEKELAERGVKLEANYKSLFEKREAELAEREEKVANREHNVQNIRNIAAQRKSEIETLKEGLADQVEARRKAETELRDKKKELDQSDEKVAALILEKKEIRDKLEALEDKAALLAQQLDGDAEVEDSDLDVELTPVGEEAIKRDDDDKGAG